MAQAGLIDAIASTDKGQADAEPLPTEDAIQADPRLGDDQKAALIAVYRSMLGGSSPSSAS
jgi:hypothetical protein